MKEKLIVLRNFLYRFFVIGFVVSIIAQLPFLWIKESGVMQVSQILHVMPSTLFAIVISFIAYVRVALIYFVLCPALALHWTIKRDKID